MESNSSPSSAVLALLHSCFNTHRCICILIVAPYLRLPIYGLGSRSMLNSGNRLLARDANVQVQQTCHDTIHGRLYQLTYTTGATTGC